MAVVWGVQGGGKYSKLGLFSKATFRLEDGQDIDIEDKDFWIKVPLHDSLYTRHSYLTSNTHMGRL
jgi:hypothetical protein